MEQASSSSSEDWSSSSDDGSVNEKQQQAEAKDRKQKATNTKGGPQSALEQQPFSDSGEEESESEEDESEREDEITRQTLMKRSRVEEDEEDQSDDEDSDHSNENESENDDNPNLTLGERLSRREHQQASQVAAMVLERKERKAKARKLMEERLAQFQSNQANSKGEQQQQQNEAAAINPVNHANKPAKPKKSKHAPTEASSKRKDFYRRRRNLNESGIGVDIGANRYKPRDPRMSSLSGHLNEEHFEHNYAFVNEVREKEMEQLKKRIEARKMTGTKGNKKRRKLGLTTETQGSLEEDVQKLRHLQQQKADLERHLLEREAKRSVKKRLQQEVESGQRSGKHFLKRREMKHLFTEAKFEEIRKRGGDAAVDKALSKRRKKNKSRDARGFGSHHHNNYT